MEKLIKYKLLLLVWLCAACNDLQPKKMSKQEKFSWYLTITAPEDYPVQVHKGGYLATDKDFITGIANVGVQSMGWRKDEMGGVGGGSVIPTKLSLTWVSYAEKKFWKIDTALPADTMLALFRKGFMFTDRTGVTSRVTYQGITIGLAPGGVVVLWLVAPFQRTEVGRFQAKETFVSAAEFMGPQGRDYATQQEFYDWWYNHLVSKEVQERIKAQGIPFGLWDAYRVHYHYRFRIQFYMDDKEKPERDITYLNGEREIFEGDEISMFRSRPLPWRAEFFFNAKWADAEFNDEEIMTAFKELTKTNKNEQIEIVGKVGFMYNDMSFTVKNGTKEILLKQVKVNMWNNASQ
jgi:hypothetical protein